MGGGGRGWVHGRQSRRTMPPVLQRDRKIIETEPFDDGVQWDPVLLDASGERFFERADAGFPSAKQGAEPNVLGVQRTNHGLYYPQN